MFEKFAEDIYKAAMLKLAACYDYIEKTAAKWARTNAKRLGKNYTMDNFVKDYNAAYGTVNPGRVNPFAAKLNNQNLTAGQRAKIQKLHDNWNLTNINPNGAPVKNNLTFAESTLNRPAQSMFNYIDNTMTPEVAKQMREGRNNAKNFAGVVREVGGKNPIIKGLATNKQGVAGNAAGNTGARYATMDGDTANAVSGAVQSREKNPKIRQTEKEFVANNPSGVTPDSEHISMFSGRADVAGNYATVDGDPNTFTGNFAVGNLNNIYPALAARGIGFTPKLDSFNLPYRIGYPRMLENATGMRMTPYIKSLYGGRVPNQELSRKYEVAIPKNITGDLNAKNIHVFDKNGKSLWGTFKGMNQPEQYTNDESYFNLKNFINRAPGMENIQAIPLDQYLNVTNGLQNNFRSWQPGKSQSANKILETLGKFGVDPSLLNPYK